MAFMAFMAFMAAHEDPRTGEGLASWPTGRLLSAAARPVEQRWTDRLDKLGLSHAGPMVLHTRRGGALSQPETVPQ